MATNVEIISKEMIKPSSPTPTHLKTLKLSFLDQIAPPTYIPLILFYHHQQLITSNPLEISPSLKQSLSKILTIFYPLGGVFQENSSVDCNDSGAEFTEARVGARLSDVIHEANVEELKKLLPVDSLGQDENIVLKVRINFLSCGGVAVAICLSHKLGDGTSLVAFVEAWATTCRGKTLIFNPSFDLASFFPPIPQTETLDFIQGAGITSEKIVTKRVVFSKKNIEKLIKECSNGGPPSPTKVEAVSSYIWRRFIEADKAKVGPQTMSLFAASHVVNLRPRKKRPPFSDNMFGNCWRSAIALSTPEDCGCSELAAKLRAAITNVDEGFIKKVENGEHMNDMKRSVDLFMKAGVEFCHFSSWCRFPIYEVADFGWGKPIWVRTTSVPFKNVAILMRTPCGEGIEAWVNLLEDDLEAFEQLI